ncbi:MAG: hypothetical protein OWQ50_05085 [Acidianus infernus]|nr:hypothetical protein [Acidianus infernus]
MGKYYKTLSMYNQVSETELVRLAVLETIENMDTKVYRCPFCGKDLTTVFVLKTHILSVHRDQPLECPACKTRVKNVRSLLSHCLHMLKRDPKDEKHRLLYLLLNRTNKVPGRVKLLRRTNSLLND